MKRLSKLIIAFIGVLSLTSCFNLFPTGPRRRSENSINNYDVVGSGKYELAGPRGTEVFQIGDEIWWNYTVYDIETGANMRISKYSFNYDGDDGGIDISETLQNDDHFLEVKVKTYESGIYYFGVSLTISSGETFHRKHRVLVNSNYRDADVYVDYPYEVQINRDSSTELYIKAWDSYTGQDKTLDPNHPYEIGYLDTQVVNITGYQLYDNSRYMHLSISSSKNGYSDLELKLIFDDGSTFNITIYVFVRPDLWLQCNDDLIIDSGDSIIATFEFTQYDSMYGESDAYINPDNLYVELFNGFSCDIVGIDENKISLLINNDGNGDFGNLVLCYFDETGCYFEWGFQVISEDAYIRNRWIDVGFGVLTHDSTSSMRIYLYTYGRPALIKSISIESYYGLIPDLPETYVGLDVYEYTFVPIDSGYDEIHITIVDENDNTFETTCSFEIN